MKTKFKTNFRLLMYSTPMSLRSQRNKSENTSELILKSNVLAYSVLRNSSEEEEQRDSASSMTTKTPWERSSPLQESREPNSRKSPPKTERRLLVRKKEEKSKKSRSTKSKERLEPREDKTRILLENKARRRSNFTRIILILHLKITLTNIKF